MTKSAASPWIDRSRVADFMLPRPSRDELLDTDTGVILYLEDITVGFDGFRALNELTLYIRTGELRCIIGPNGAGKTTLMDVISGKTQADSGTAFFGQRLDLGRYSEAEIANLGIGRKFQKPSIFATHTVFENLELAMHGDKRVWSTLFAQLTPAQRDRIDEVIAFVGLQEVRTRPAGTLAHGQKQWLEIGMLLMQNPLLLLVDEPVAGMTQQEVEATAELLNRLVGEHSVVVIEHDMDFVRSIARTVTVLHEGSVLAEGPFDQIQADPLVRQVYLGE